MRGKSIFKVIHSVLVLLLIIGMTESAFAFPQKVKLSLDTTAIRIGDQVQLKLQVTLPVSSIVHWPIINDTLTSSVEVSKKSKVDSTLTTRNDFVNYLQLITITSFDTGYHLIPPFSISYVFKGDTTQHQLQTEGVFLKVYTIEVDTTKAIRDIKAPLGAPVTIQEFLPYIAGIAIVGLIVGLVWYYFWRRKMKKPIFPMLVKQQGPPWQDALMSLTALHEKRLWQNGKLKEYYTELTDIIRLYLFKQHNIEALEMITSEILDAYSKSALHPESKKILSEILSRADLVKFAKGIPLPADNEYSLAQTREVINNTKPQSTENEKNQSEVKSENS